MSNSSPCNECPFKQSIPGDCHVTCVHPVANGERQMMILMLVMTGKLSTIEEALGLKIDPHGAASGWANFPVNYDPIWVTGTCSMLENYKKALAVHQDKQAVDQIIHKES